MVCRVHPWRDADSKVRTNRTCKLSTQRVDDHPSSLEVISSCQRPVFEGRDSLHQVKQRAE